MREKKKTVKLLFILMVVFLVLLGCSLVLTSEDDAAIEEDNGLVENESYINRASEHLALGNLELALEYFEDAIFHEEELALAWRGVGLIRFDQQDFLGARQALETSLELGGIETEVIYNVLGVSAMRTSDYSGAITFFDLGIALIDRENIENTENIENIKAMETLQSMMHNRIVAYQQLSDWSGAREAAREYLQIFPDDDVVQREYEFLRTR